MNLKHQSNFTVYPEDANNSFPLIHGGSFFSHMDKLAASAAKRLLYESETCETSVTHKFEGVFHKPTYVGDLIFLEAEVVNLGKKSIALDVKAFRENRDNSRDLMAEAKYVFITIVSDETIASKPDMLPYAEHGLKMPS